MKLGRRGVWLFLLATTPLFTVPSGAADAQSGDASAADTAAAGCVTPIQVYPATGPACQTADGLFAVFAGDGTLLGFTHGPDGAPADGSPEDGPTPADAKPVLCASGTAGTYYIQVIYARPADGPDGYSSNVSAIRSMTQSANNVLNNAAVATGGVARLRVKCVSGQVEVKNVVLPTSKNSDSYSTIANDLINKGYSDKKFKYLVYYDDPVGGFGGQGAMENDDSLSVNNLNNGNAARVHFAISYQYLYTSVWLHELSHNMGAVQLSAPHSTGAGHCWDGRDTMCYDDGGPDGWRYSTSFCSSEIYDCGKDDYFNRNPSSSNYLRTHWNIGNSINRFVDFTSDGTAPSLTVDDPAAGYVYVGGYVFAGCAKTDSGQSGVATYVSRVCVQGSASDGDSGIQSIKAYEDNVLKDSTTSGGSFSFAWTVASTKTTSEIKVVAENNDGGTRIFTANARLVSTIV